MAEHDLEPLPPDVLALVAAARPIDGLGASRQAAIFGAIASRVGLPPGPGRGPGSEGGGGAGEGGADAPAGGAGAGAGAAAGGLRGLRAVLALAGTFTVGAAAGVAVDRGVVARPRAAPVALSVEERTPREPAVASVATASSPPVVSIDALPLSGSATRPAAQRPEPIPSSRGLAAERALLDVARTALARGEPAQALAATNRHAHEYPDGALVEEREALAIKALVALGRRDEARTRAREFERRFPNGLMLRAVKGAVEGAP
jgi:hypothetical protein